MARIQRQGKRYQENFGVTAYGGWNDAVAAAKEWVEKMRTKLPPAITSKDKLTSRKSSGIVGVHLHRQVVGSSIR